MTMPELLTGVLIAGSGGLLVKLIDVAKDWLSERGKNRRKEVDVLASALKQKQAECTDAERKYRVLTEQYHELRVWVIRTGLHDPSEIPDIEE